MEFFDILDETGAPVGRTHERGKPLAAGDYHLVVSIWIRNGAGLWLVQKRADTVKASPGLWANTAGAAQAGETSRQAAAREVREELGLALDPQKLEFLWRAQRESFFSDVYFLPWDGQLDQLRLQKEEVADARWISTAQMRAMLADGSFLHLPNMERLFAHFGESESLG